MTDDGEAARWERIKTVFADALEREGPDRAAFVEQATRGDPDLEREVSSLLDAHTRAGELMASPTLAPEDIDPDPPAQRGAPARLEQLGRYRIRSLLGSGGMGEVYLAHDPRLDRQVALKVLPADLAEHPHRRARFLQEARAAASLNHPNITTIHEIGEAEGRDYIAFEYVEGRTLREWIGGRPLELRALVDIAAPLADALAHAHERGLIHRDIKSANVMVTARGQPKLLDFGLAKLVHARAAPERDGADGGAPGPGDSPPALTLSGTIAGTPEAMSPEQAAGRPVDQRTDVFSFGSLLHEMASGRAAFSGNGSQETLEAVMHKDPPPLRALRPDLPGEFHAIVDRALRKQPDDRYQRFAELSSDLRQLQRATDTGLFAAAQAGSATDGARVSSGPAPAARRAWPARTSALLGTLLALLLVLVWWQGRPAGGIAPDATSDGTGSAAPAGSPPVAPEPSLAAVMSFENTSDPADSGDIGAMLSRLLTTHLATGGGIHMLSQQRLYEVARDLGREDGRVDRSIATAVAQRAGVDTMILGEVGHTGETLVATVEVVDVASGRTLGSHQARGTATADIFSMAASLGRQVRDTLREPALSDAEKRALDDQLTTSVEAFRAYVRGLEALQRNHPDDAVEALRQATALDPAFALAQFRLAMSLVWTGRFDEIKATMDRTFAFLDRLPANIQLLLTAARPYFDNDDSRTALPALLRVIADDPQNADALYFLGEIYTHSATRNDSHMAAEMYERLLSLDRGLSLVYDHLLSAYLRSGRFDEARARVEAWRQLAPDNLAEMEGMLALWEDRFAEAAGLLRDRLAPDLLVDTSAADEPADSAGEPPAVSAVLAQHVPQLIAELHDLNGIYWSLAMDLRADVLAQHGRFAEAEQLCRLAADVPTPHHIDGFYTSVQGATRHRLAALRALQGDLAGARSEIAGTLTVQPDNFRCLYTEAHFALQDHDEATAQRDLDQLTELVAANWGPTTSLYRDGVAAELELFRGHAVEARTLFAALVNSGRLLEDWYAYEDSIGPLLRDGLARACLAAGDPAGAAAAWDGLLASGIERLRQPLPFVQALHARGMLALQQGDEATGRALLARFLHCWGNDGADPAVLALPSVQEARARLGAPVPH